VPFAVPDGWVWVRLGEVSLISGGMQKTPHRTPAKNFYPYLGVQNVQRGYLNLNEIKYFEATEAELERLMLMKNDLLIIEGNGSIKEIGRCAIWNEEIENCIHQNHIMRCRPFINSQSNFFITVLNSKFGIEQMQQKARTTTGLFNLSVGKLSTVRIPLPPLAEQYAIVERVDRLLNYVSSLESQVSERKSYAEQLMQAVLEEAFVG
jgi:type I restriction enzyme S subunit